MSARDRISLFRALLRHYRNARGMSQLDLSSASEVSSRHISFLETGRAQPSREMVLRLSSALGLSLRDSNALLQAAGLELAFPETRSEEPLPPVVERVIAHMLKQQEPYPMVVLNARYDLLRTNQGALQVFSRFVDDPTLLLKSPNILHLAFAPGLMRPYIENWETVARLLLTQLQRYALSRPADDSIPALVRELCAYPDVPADWRQPALELPPMSVLEFGMRRGDLKVRFITTLTIFNAPLDLMLEDLKLESYFPADEETAALCKSLAGS